MKQISLRVARKTIVPVMFALSIFISQSHAQTTLQQAHPRYDVYLLPTLGGAPSTIVTGLTEEGIMLGSSQRPSCSRNCTVPVVWRDGQIQQLQTIGSTGAAYHASRTGPGGSLQYFGSLYDPVTFSNRLAIWAEDGTIEEVREHSPGYVSTQIVDGIDSGVITYQETPAPPYPSPLPSRSFIEGFGNTGLGQLQVPIPNGISSLRATSLSEGGFASVAGIGDNGFRAFRYDYLQGVMTELSPLPGQPEAFANKATSQGHILGGSRFEVAPGQTLTTYVLWEQGSVTPEPLDSSFIASDINDSMQIVGFHWLSTGVAVASLRLRSGTLLNLNSQLSTVLPSKLHDAKVINNRGQIVARFFTSGPFTRDVLLTPR